MARATDQVAVVTDTTSSLPPELAAQVTVVPLHVVLGARTGLEGRDVHPDDVAAALRAKQPVTTSRPTPGELAQAYRTTGARRVVSVHLSAALSGTHDAALLAAEQVANDGIEVHVVDSRSIGMGLGFAVLAAAAAARAAHTGEQVADRARRTAEQTSVLFCVDTLEHLRRGGRIGSAAALVGAALAVKPLLSVQNGCIGALERVRTSARATARLEQLAVDRAGTGGVDLAVHHLAAPQRARELAERLSARLPDVGKVYLSEVGAALGAHVGPGLLGIVVSPR